MHSLRRRASSAVPQLWSKPWLLQADGDALQSPQSTGDPMKGQQSVAPGKKVPAKPGECSSASVHG